jgi:hypothetical protein
MAAKRSSPVVRMVATVFTSLVAPSLVAVFTTAIREVPKTGSTQTVCAYQGTPTPTVEQPPTPAVTLLPPEAVVPAPVAIRGPLVWRPVAPTNDSAVGRRTLAQQ